jgi:PD-(D/E)XK nuclease superfamily
LGRVAHRALDRITQAVNRSGASGPEATVAQLRVLGGLTRVIDNCVTDELAQLDGNPRARSRTAALDAALRQRVSELRLLVQSALNIALKVGEAHEVYERPIGQRAALGLGYHPEVELAPQDLAWVGYADAIRLTPDSCEIIDYKTGTPSASHEEQLRLYALLWARDAVVNPISRLADRLLVVYPGRTHELPAPNAIELAALEAHLVERGHAAITALEEVPPRAVVSPEGCRFCDVKQLCSGYWTTQGQALMREPTIPEYRSLQAVVEGRIGDSTVTIVVELDPYLTPGTRALLARVEASECVPGQRLRLMDVRVTLDPEDNQPLISYGRQSELFRVEAS